MLFISCFEQLSSLCSLKAQPSGQLREGAKFQRQTVGLPIVHHLQMMLNRPQEDVAVAQDPRVLGGEVSQGR